MFHVHSLRFKSITVLVLSLGLLLLLQTLYVGPMMKEERIQGAIQVQGEIAGQLAHGMDFVFQKAVAELEAISKRPGLGTLEPALLDRAISEMDRVTQFFDYYFVLDKNGIWISYPSRPELVGEGIPRENMEWVRETVETNRTTFLDVVRSRVGTLVSGFATPIPSEKGEPLAILRGVIVLSKEKNFLTAIADAKVGKGGYAYIVASNGRLLAHPKVRLDPEALTPYDYNGYPPVQGVMRGESGFCEYEYEQETWVASYRPIRTTGWGVIAQQPKRDIVASAEKQVAVFNQLFFLAFALSGLIMGITIHLALRPLGSLLQMVRSRKVDVERELPKDEVGQLAGELKKLYAELFQSNLALRESEEKYRLLVEGANEGIVLTQQGRLRYMNPVALRYMGFREDEIASVDLMDSIHPEDRERMAKLYLAKMSGEEVPPGTVFRILDKEGKSRWVQSRSTILSLDGKPALLTFLIDITEQKQAEDALRESEEQYRLVVDHAREGIIMTQAGKVVFLNDRAAAHSGYSREEIFSSNMSSFVHPDDLEGALRRYVGLLQGETFPEDYDYRIMDKNGKVRWVRSHSVLIQWKGEPAVLTFMNEITAAKQAEEEKEELEAQLRQAQKMEAIGTLAGGIAHDFNNILGAIIGYTELAQMEMKGDDRASSSLGQVLKAAERAKELVKQILAFSRQTEQERKPTHIGLIAREALKLLRASIPVTIEIRQNIATDQGAVLADPTQIHQVVMNLCTNAAHAMSDKGGVLEVEVRSTELKGSSGAGPHPLDPGLYVELRVSDTGQGMTPEIMGRIFDPYFTTKRKGTGTGLGLAVVHGIVKSHGGSISVESEPGKGSRFQVLFPRIDRAEAAKPEVRSDTPRGHERVLFVDDEEMLANVGKRMLERLGYQVTSETDSDEALLAFKENPDRFDLVITDQTMPHMTGTALAQEIMRLRPDIPVILCTGYSELLTESKVKAAGLRAYVMKPLLVHELAVLIRRVLDGVAR